MTRNMLLRLGRLWCRVAARFASALVVGILLLHLSTPARADLLIASFENDTVLRYDSTTGAFLGKAIVGNAVDAPIGIAVGVDQRLYVGGKFSGSILRYDLATGALVGEFVPWTPAGIDSPSNIHFAPNGNLYAASYGMDTVREFDAVTGALVRVVASDPSLHDPLDFAYGPNGDFFVSGTLGLGSTNAIFQFDGDTGELIRTAGSQFGHTEPWSITFGPDGNLWVSSATKGAVIRFDGSTLAFLGVFAEVRGASGLAFGPDGNLYVASRFNNSVVRLNPQTGALIDTFVAPGSGGLNGPKTILFTASVPEPSTLALGLVGMLCGLILQHVRRRL